MMLEILSYSEAGLNVEVGIFLQKEIYTLRGAMKPTEPKIPPSSQAFPPQTPCLRAWLTNPAITSSLSYVHFMCGVRKQVIKDYIHVAYI